jgi:benzoyl-CoA reductase subunit C
MQSLATDAYDVLADVAADPAAYAARWKERTGGPVIGAFPMNFPLELVHAAGGLPVIVQDSRTPITEGRSLLPEFYCSYTRSVADQAAVGELDVFDGFVLADHCVQLLGAADVIRWALPEKPMHFAQFISSMDDPWSRGQVVDKIGALKAEIEEVAGTEITAEALRDSIRAYNEGRELIRRVFELRKTGRVRVPASQLQILVASSMVMDPADHTPLLRDVLSRWEASVADDAGIVPVHLSGHFCARPRTELLDLIEDCGMVVVDDDLYHGFRYVSSDVPETGDPFESLADWYLHRNVAAPCATRVQRDVDWDTYMIDELRTSGAVGVLVLMAKFCEPLMLYYPELRKALEARGVPLLLIETEHEGLAAETTRTRLEAFVERIRRAPAPVPSPA